MAIEFLFPPSLGKRLATVRAELLSIWLGPWLGQPVLVKVADSYEDLENRLLAGETDVVWAPPALCARAWVVARYILKAVRSGHSQYRSALVCRAEDALSPDDLRGLRAAWVDPRSTAGYLLPRAALERHGYDPDELLGEQRFLGSYRFALQAVLNRDADLAPVFVQEPEASSLRHSLAAQLGSDADRLGAVLYTGESPTDGLVFSTRLSEPDACSLLEALIPASGGRAASALLDLFNAEAFEMAEASDFAALRPPGAPPLASRPPCSSDTPPRLRAATGTEEPPLRSSALVGLVVDCEGVCRDLWVRAPHREDETTDRARGRTLVELFGAHPGRELAQLVKRAARTGERVRHEYCLEHPDSVRWFCAELMGRAESAQDTWLLVVRETTARRELERNLVELASFPLLNPNPSLEVTDDGRVTYLNPSAREIFPDLPERGAEHPLLAALSPLRALAVTCATGPVRRHATVDERCYDLTISLVPDSSRLRIDAVDISVQDTMERALRASEQRYRLLFEKNLAGVYQTTVEGRILKCNASFARLLGYDGAEALEGTCLSSLFVNDEAWLDRVTRLAKRSAMHNLEVGLRRRDGGTAWVLMSEHLVELEPGRATVEGTVVDITERRQMESNMLQTAQMLSIGTLAAGIAHELNNPLTCVLGNLYVVDQQLRSLREEIGTAGPKLQDWLREITEALREASDGADRARTIVRDMRTFSRVDEQTIEALDVHEVLEASIKMSRSELRHRARLIKDYGDLPLVAGNRARLGQVFLNLLINAAQACSSASLDNLIRVTTRTDPRGRAVIEVHDTGSGIPEQLRSRIFEPFFTTKPIGVGTGLGLSICHTIVTGLEGDISVESEVGLGTTFRVVLPTAERVTQDHEAPSEDLTATLPAVRVLVVDDEPCAARAVQRCLHPCEVELASGGEGALARLSSGGHFEVIVCDLLMPGMSGIELFDRVRALNPELARRFLFVTGAVFTPEVREFLERVPNPRLQKPFEMDRLRALVSEMASPTGATADP